MLGSCCFISFTILFCVFLKKEEAEYEPYLYYIKSLLNLWHLFINLIQGRILEKEKLFPELKV